MEQIRQLVMKHIFEFAPQNGVLKFQHGAYGRAVWPCITQPTFLLYCAFPLSLEKDTVSYFASSHRGICFYHFEEFFTVYIQYLSMNEEIIEHFNSYLSFS